MIAPLVFFIVSLVAVAAAQTIPAFRDLTLLASACATAGLILFLRRFLRKAVQARKARQKWVIIDGSNVMHWKDGTARIDTLREVVQHLKAQGFSPGVVFDANAGHILSGKYLHHGAMGRLLGLPEDKVMVVHKGTQADSTILAAAKDLGARVVTNDRYRDWVDMHPEVQQPGYLIKGGYRAGKLWVDAG
jgi:Zc3h12a-like Ribonuclease NYN domain